MTELHDAFSRWLVAGHRDAVARDVGLHAAGCAGCAIASDAFDALERVDPAAAPEPALVHGPVPSRRRVAPAGWIAAAATIVAAVAVGGFVAANLPAATSGTAQAVETGSFAPIAVGTPGGGVLAGGPEHNGSPTATPITSDRPDASPSGSSGQAVVVPPWHPEPTPSFRGNPVPTIAPGPSRTAAPSPTPVASVDPTPAPPTSTPTPTPEPTPTPTPTPEPTPEPLPECSNGVDDDGDGLTDMDDPECLAPTDDSEVVP